MVGKKKPGLNWPADGEYVFGQIRRLDQFQEYKTNGPLIIRGIHSFLFFFLFEFVEQVELKTYVSI